LDSIWLPSKVKGVGFSSEKDMKKALNKDWSFYGKNSKKNTL
jgi:hypothetical protein